jgi:hypothetical protein
MANFSALVMPNRYAIRSVVPIYERIGEGGIRTLGSLLGYGALAKRCFQPLSHLTKNSPEYRAKLWFSNLEFAIADTDFVACSRFHRSCQFAIAN